jgi:hypothetical protein
MIEEQKTHKEFRFGISGHCKREFEPVIAELEALAEKGIDKTGQLCVYVGNECVIDVV